MGTKQSQGTSFRQGLEYWTKGQGSLMKMTVNVTPYVWID